MEVASNLWILNIGVSGSLQLTKRVILGAEEVRRKREEIRTRLSNNFLCFDESPEEGLSEVYLYKGGIVRLPLNYNFVKIATLKEGVSLSECVQKPLRELPNCISLVHERRCSYFSSNTLMGMVRFLGIPITFMDYFYSVNIYKPRKLAEYAKTSQTSLEN